MAAGWFTGIDHVTLAVGDLSEAVDTFVRMGFALTPYGRHEDHGTANHCIMMPRDYLEVAGLARGRAAEDDYRRRIEGALSARGSGIMALTLGTEDGALARESLSRIGVEAGMPRTLHRVLKVGDETIRPAVSAMILPPETLPGVSVFVAQHLTPALIRRSSWMEHPNGAVGLASLTLVVEDPAAARIAFERLFGPGVAVLTDTTVAVHLGDFTIFLCSPEQLTQLHPDCELADRMPKAPAVVGVEFRVRDLEGAARVLTANRVPFCLLKEGMLRVPPSETLGTLLEFSQTE